MHVVVWTAEGSLFSWGAGRLGQLGTGTTENIDAPQQVKALEAVPTPARRQVRTARWPLTATATCGAGEKALLLATEGMATRSSYCRR